MAVADDQEAIASPLFVVEAHEAFVLQFMALRQLLWSCGNCGSMKIKVVPI